MARIEVDIDIEDYLDEVDTEDLINELEQRKDWKGKRHLLDSVALDEAMGLLKVTSLREVVKFEAFVKVFRNIPESELDEFLRKYE